MAPSEDDRLTPDRPRTEGEVARSGTEPHGSTSHQDRRSVDPRGSSGSAPAAVSRIPAGSEPLEGSKDSGLPAGGSPQETALHGKPATAGGSNEHARLPDTSHRDL